MCDCVSERPWVRVPCSGAEAMHGLDFSGFDWLWVRSGLEEMKYFIFIFLSSGV